MRHSINISENNRGAGMVSAIVIAAVVSGLMYVMAQVSKNQSFNNKTIRNKTIAQKITEDMASKLMFPGISQTHGGLCKLNFGGIAIGTAITTIEGMNTLGTAPFAGTPIYTTATKYLGLEIVSMKLEYIPPAVSCPNNQQCKITLKVEFRSTGSSAVNLTFKKDVYLYVYSVGGIINDCYSKGNKAVDETMKNVCDNLGSLGPMGAGPGVAHDVAAPIELDTYFDTDPDNTTLSGHVKFNKNTQSCTGLRRAFINRAKIHICAGIHAEHPTTAAAWSGTGDTLKYSCKRSYSIKKCEKENYKVNNTLYIKKKQSFIRGIFNDGEFFCFYYWP